MDQATTELIQQDVKGRFPADAGVSVAVLQYGDDPAVEPGQITVRLTIEPPAAAAGDEHPDEHPMDAFHRAYRETIEQLRRDISERFPDVSRFEIRSGEKPDRRFMVRLHAPDEPASDLTPVMARLGPDDLETLDTLITAGIAPNRAQAVRWALARIRERPAYAQLRDRAREIEALKSQF
jgi:hypothetical protein